MTDETKVIEGVCEFYSETGTEGGYWAVYDTSVDTKQPPPYGLSSKEEVFDPADPERKGTVKEAWFADGRAFPDPINHDPDYYLSSLFRGASGGDPEADARLEGRWGFKMGEAPPYGTPNSPRPYGASKGAEMVARVAWSDGTVECRRSDELLVVHRSYGGLNVLENGDRLTIYNPEDRAVVWMGEINLIEHELFTEDASGLWIHNDQEGVDREEWANFFFREYPARLERKV